MGPSSFEELGQIRSCAQDGVNQMPHETAASAFEASMAIVHPDDGCILIATQVVFDADAGTTKLCAELNSIEHPVMIVVPPLVAFRIDQALEARAATSLDTPDTGGYRPSIAVLSALLLLGLAATGAMRFLASRVGSADV